MRHRFHWQRRSLSGSFLQRRLSDPDHGRRRLRTLRSYGVRELTVHRRGGVSYRSLGEQAGSP